MESERRRHRGWLMTGVALLVAALLFIAKLIFQTSRWLDYLRHRSTASGGTGVPLQFPVEVVASTSALIVVEAAALWVVLTQIKGPLWIRAGMTSLVTLIAVACLVMMMSTGESPPAYAVHLGWLFSVSVVLALLSLALGIARIIEGIRER